MVHIDERLYIKYRKIIGRARMDVILHALVKSSVLDSINIREADSHDNIFVPKTPYEKAFWKPSRKMIKEEAIELHRRIKAGKLGGRPKKILTRENEGDSISF